MNFITEFEISIQSPKEEETYMKSLYDAICKVVPEENRAGKLFEVNYLAKNRKNQITVNWRAEDESFIPIIANAFKKEKWLKRHNLFNVATIY